jgi:two-component system, NarL family, response regulator DesR
VLRDIPNGWLLRPDRSGCAFAGSIRRAAEGVLPCPCRRVRNYLSSAIGKTHARNRIEAAETARRNGWL